MANKQARTWWRKVREWWQHPKRLLLLQLSAVALTFTAGSLILSYPPQYLLRPPFERVTGTVVGKKWFPGARAGEKSGSYYVVVATAQGERYVRANPYYHSWQEDKNIHVGDRLDSLISSSFVVELRMNERLLFTYEDYCREEEKEQRFASTLFGVLAVFCWLAVAYQLARYISQTNPKPPR